MRLLLIFTVLVSTNAFAQDHDPAPISRTIKPIQGIHQLSVLEKYGFDRYFNFKL